MPNLYKPAQQSSNRFSDSYTAGSSRFRRFFFRVRRLVEDDSTSSMVSADLLFATEGDIPGCHKLHNDSVTAQYGGPLFSLGYQFKSVDNVVGSGDSVRSTFTQTPGVKSFNLEVMSHVKSSL